MIGLALLVTLAGIALAIRPDAWWRLHEPPETRGGAPTEAYLRKTRTQGITFILGGIALLIVQFLKTLA